MADNNNEVLEIKNNNTTTNNTVSAAPYVCWNFDWIGNTCVNQHFYKLHVTRCKNVLVQMTEIKHVVK